MSFAIQVDQDQAVINNKLIGEFTPALILEFFNDLSLKLRQSGITRVFSDITEVELGLSNEEYERISDELAELQMPAGLRQALFVQGDLAEQQNRADLLFGKSKQELRLFQNEEEARQWLSEGK